MDNFNLFIVLSGIVRKRVRGNKFTLKADSNLSLHDWLLSDVPESLTWMSCLHGLFFRYSTAITDCALLSENEWGKDAPHSRESARKPCRWYSEKTCPCGRCNGNNPEAGCEETARARNFQWPSSPMCCRRKLSIVQEEMDQERII